ncbi:MAG: Mur ligase family protein [Bacilli bacterium]
MKYKDIIEKLKEYNLVESYDDVDINLSYLSYNSKDIKENTLFICKGVEFKENYLTLAISKGVTCYISEKDYNKKIPKIIVKDARSALAVISSLFYPDNLFKIGITGTKGKTTTNYFIHNILKNHLGYEPGIFATHYFYTGKSSGENHLTTPESLELHKYLNEMKQENLKYMSMEVSSQAEYHKRDFGMSFNIGCFLNISEDHISPLEHKNFDEYLNCKLEFLRKCETVIVFKHTDCYDKVIETVKDKKIITFGYTQDCDYIIKNVINNNGLSFELEHNNRTQIYEISMSGRFNVINASCAIIIAKLINISYDNILKGLLETEISGRMNVIKGGICPIIVDYAHNELSAKALYESLKEDYPDKKIKVVFGCPGDKGVNRRKDMGMLAGLYADYVYLTAEDPGHLKVKEICEDIAKYIEKYHHNYEIIEDRKTAIKKAINDSTKDDVIALLGKGDENYQIIEGKWIPYETDSVIVKKELSKIKEKS